MNDHMRKMWIDADNWQYSLEQSRRWTPEDRRKHVALGKVKHRIDAIEQAISKESCNSNNELYIYRQPTNDTDRCNPVFNSETMYQSLIKMSRA